MRRKFTGHGPALLCFAWLLVELRPRANFATEKKGLTPKYTG